MEQRYPAVSAVIHDGLSVAEVANRFGVLCQRINFWLLKYQKKWFARTDQSFIQGTLLLSSGDCRCRGVGL
jgi:transposase